MSTFTRHIFPAICVILACQLPVPGQTTPLAGANTIGIFRPSQGLWYVNANGTHNYLGGAKDPIFGFGINGDLPVVGNWTGANPAVLQVGIFRDGYWFLDWNNNQFWDAADQAGGILNFGEAGDIPVVGDWDGSGKLRI